LLRLALLLAARAAATDVVSMPRESVAGRVVDTLAASATPAEMLAKCREMKAVLRDCGKNTDTIVDLLRDVEREEQPLRRIRRSAAARCSPRARGCVQSAISGAVIGSDAADWSAQGNSVDTGRVCCGTIGCALGGAAISALGAIIGAVTRHQTIVAYRERVNTLVRRVNRAVAATP
jgi:hypothetical protein